MNEKSLTVLEQYEINLKEIFRTRGNYGCVTEKDIYILQEYNDGEKKGGTHNLIGTYLEKNGLSAIILFQIRKASMCRSA